MTDTTGEGLSTELPATGTDKRIRLLGIATGTAALALLFGFMAFITWRRWADPLVDFGEELYVPWQMLSGQTLYKDLYCLSGPLSPYFNMALFAVFGVSYKTLFVANMAILALFLAILWHLLARATSRTNAFIAAGIVISVFGFAQYIPTSNYNFISPYKHAATHGLFLSLLLLYLLVMWHAKASSWMRSSAAGVCFGCVLLTKPEIGFAAGVTVAAFFAIMAFRKDRDIGFGRAAAAFAISLFLPALIFLWMFSSQMPVKDALRAVVNHWAVLGSGLTRNEFYRTGMGMDAPIRNAVLALVSAGIAAGGIVVLRLASHHAVRQESKSIHRILWVIAVAGVIGLSLFVTPYNAARGFPILCAVSAGLLIWLWWKGRIAGAAPQRGEITLLLLSVFALAMLPKMLLNCRIYHYGFYMALPAAVLISAMSFWIVPDRLGEKPEGRRLYRTAIGLIFAFFCVSCILPTNAFSWMKTVPVGEGKDTIFTYGPDFGTKYLVEQVDDWISKNTKPEETLTVIPEGIMINYLARRRTPIPVMNFMPPEVRAFGEDNILAAFRSTPPDYILLVHKNAQEYGFDYFGSDPQYGEQIMNWVQQEYEPVWQMGDEPLKERTMFGMEMMKKKQ